MKIRLPNLKITHSAFPAKVVVPRGRCTAIPERDVVQTAPETHEEQDSVTKSFMVANAESIAYSSLHDINETANASNWGKIRPTLLRTLTELCAMPIGVCCCICGAKAESRCLQCGATIYYCLKCFKDHHSAVNIFHMCEVWDEGIFKPLLLKNRKVDVLAHECLSKKDIPLCCIDAQGIEHEIMFACCDCEPTAVTLVRARLWPASPCLPKLAFAFELLEWAEALLLECQVALGDFCRAIYFKCQNNIVMKRKEVYSALINAFEEFRFMKVELRHLSFISDKLDKENTCPACPKMLSLDYQEKKSSGQSHREPLHGHIFFKSQSSVDEHVASAPQRKVCNMETYCAVLTDSKPLMRQHYLVVVADMNFL